MTTEELVGLISSNSVNALSCTSAAGTLGAQGNLRTAPGALLASRSLITYVQCCKQQGTSFVAIPGSTKLTNASRRLLQAPPRTKTPCERASGSPAWLMRLAASRLKLAVRLYSLTICKTTPLKVHHRSCCHGLLLQSCAAWNRHGGRRRRASDSWPFICQHGRRLGECNPVYFCRASADAQPPEPSVLTGELLDDVILALPGMGWVRAVSYRSPSFLHKQMSNVIEHRSGTRQVGHCAGRSCWRPGAASACGVCQSTHRQSCM